MGRYRHDEWVAVDFVSIRHVTSVSAVWGAEYPRAYRIFVHRPDNTSWTEVIDMRTRASLLVCTNTHTPCCLARPFGWVGGTGIDRWMARTVTEVGLNER